MKVGIEVMGSGPGVFLLEGFEPAFKVPDTGHDGGASQSGRVPRSDWVYVMQGGSGFVDGRSANGGGGTGPS